MDEATRSKEERDMDCHRMVNRGLNEQVDNDGRLQIVSTEEKTSCLPRISCLDCTYLTATSVL